MTASVARFIESFIPENYNLFLDINRSEKTFTGNVAITGEALDNHISLHQKDLTISSVLLDNESLNFQMDDANEAFHIEVELQDTSCCQIRDKADEQDHRRDQNASEEADLSDTSCQLCSSELR